MIHQQNNYWLLDSVFGWPFATQSGIHITPSEGDITLEPLPGSATFLDDSLINSIVCPVALAANSNGDVFVMDGLNARVTILSIDTSPARQIAAFGGRGSGLRQFKGPRSLAVLPSGSIAIADTGNDRVQLFSGPPYVLLRVWGAPDVYM